MTFYDKSEIQTFLYAIIDKHSNKSYERDAVLDDVWDLLNAVDINDDECNPTTWLEGMQ